MGGNIGANWSEAYFDSSACIWCTAYDLQFFGAIIDLANLELVSIRVWAD